MPGAPTRSSARVHNARVGICTSNAMIRMRHEAVSATRARRFERARSTRRTFSQGAVVTDALKEAQQPSARTQQVPLLTCTATGAPQWSAKSDKARGQEQVRPAPPFPLAGASTTTIRGCETSGATHLPMCPALTHKKPRYAACSNRRCAAPLRCNCRRRCAVSTTAARAARPPSRCSRRYRCAVAHRCRTRCGGPLAT